jgi:ankyrin
LAHGANPNPGDARGVTPLHLAVQVRQGPLARLLLANGADPNRTSRSGTTPLMVARRRNLRDMIELLKAHGAREQSDPFVPPRKQTP